MKFYVPILLLFVLNSCSKKSSSPTNTSSMTATISGANWNAQSVAFTYAPTSNGLISITGTASDGSKIAINMNIYPQFKPGTYNCTPISINSFTIISFQTGLTQAGAVLNWSTASEVNTDRFEIQKSTNGIDFSTIGTVAAAGNSSAVINYTFTDTNTLVWNNFYRLKMYDLSGGFSYSTIHQVNDRPEVSYTDRSMYIGASFNGMIQILTNDAANHTASGTFYFDCNVGGTILQVRNGTFNVHY